jgi:hypothetical protein
LLAKFLYVTVLRLQLFLQVLDANHEFASHATRLMTLHVVLQARKATLTRNHREA